MARSREESLRLFDSWAEAYDASVQNANGPLYGYEGSLSIVTKAFPVSDSERVLDIGIGTGRLASSFAAYGALVYGVDPSEAMLALCRSTHPSFHLAPGSFEHLPFPDRFFDAVVSSFAWHEVAPLARPGAIDQILRVLRPRGRVLLLDIVFASRTAREEARLLLGDSWDDDEDYALVEDLDSQLRCAGLRDVRWIHTGPFHWAVVAARPEFTTVPGDAPRPLE